MRSGNIKTYFPQLAPFRLGVSPLIERLLQFGFRVRLQLFVSLASDFSQATLSTRLGRLKEALDFIHYRSIVDEIERQSGNGNSIVGVGLRRILLV